MHIAFVVQRYGLKVSGGAELLCRQVVEHLAPEFEIEVLTTCAQDYVTWENVYPTGLDMINGIPVRRFPTVRTREKDFGARSAWIFSHLHTLQDEMEWLYAQGPVSPDLLRYLVEHHLDYDAFVFFTYIYYPTALGLRLVADRALLVPTAHDELPIYLNVYKAMFHAPRAIIYNTIEERQFLQDLFDIEHIPGQVTGVGVDVPERLDAQLFRRRYNIDSPYVLYVGRISPSKSCDTLIDYFIRYKAVHPGSLTLVLVGRAEIPIPKRPDIVAVGFVPDEDKFNAIAGAELFLLPSKFESLSIVFLESLAMGTPVLCDGASAILRGHCRRSNAALYYHNYPEFEPSLELLLKNPHLRQSLGCNGKQYVEQFYTWDQVVKKYRRLLTEVTENHWW
ncbi:MAG: glycosyltransferase family 1 protein [Chloroflexi bacterium]|nr:MAG: glycosyltransferase family 1 protein [Chloroflexota bacterium]